MRGSGLGRSLSIGVWVTVAIGLIVVGCGQGGDATTIDQALEAQPAGLVTAPDEISIGDSDQGGCGDFTQSVMVLELATGEVRWEVATPWGPGAPAIVDDLVVVVGERVDGYPPSVVAIELSGGRPRWQRFLDQPSAELLAATVGRVAVRVGGEMVSIGSDGNAETIAAPGATWAPIDADRPGRLVGWSNRPGAMGVFDPFSGDVVDGAPTGGPDGPIEAIGGDWYVTAGGDRIGAVNIGTGERWTGELPVDDIFVRVDRVVVGGDDLVVLLGADVGPDRRLVVLDVETGERRWTLDGVRSATMSGDAVVYDRRNTNVDEPTRDLFVVDADDPGVVRWSTASSAELGGYVGANARGLFFAVQAAEQPAELVSVSDATEVPAVLTPASTAAPAVSLATDGVVATSLEGGGLVYRAGAGPSVVVETTGTVTGLRARDDVLIVSHGRDDHGCD